MDQAKLHRARLYVPFFNFWNLNIFKIKVSSKMLILTELFYQSFYGENAFKVFQFLIIHSTRLYVLFLFNYCKLNIFKIKVSSKMLILTELFYQSFYGENAFKVFQFLIIHSTCLYVLFLFNYCKLNIF